MYLLQQPELVVDNKFRNQLTKCTTSPTTTTMKQEENHDFTRKNGLNGNVSVAESTSSSHPHNSTITLEQIPVVNTVAATNHHVVASGATSSSGRNGDHQIASSTSPHDLTTNNNNNNALRMNQNNNNNNTTNNKKTSSIENGAKPNNNNSNRIKPATITGERLQFFKDGKFILELARAREGDKTNWVSVPRKAYWPPTVSSSTSANFKKHESSASLSCSDDNSSIQSSPWQRDHSWKKTIPRQNISKEMAMFYHRPVKLIKLSKDSLKASKCKHRRPYDKRETKFTFIEQKGLKIVQFENSVNSKWTIKHEETANNGSNGEKDENGDCVDGCTKMEVDVKPEKNDDKDNIKDEKENIKEVELKSSIIKMEEGETEISSKKENITANNQRKSTEKKLDAIVKKLTDRADSGLSRLNHIKTSYQQHVSPRKRILREFEKVSLEDPQTTQKRSRAKTGVSSNISSVFDGHSYGSKSSLALLPGRSVSPQLTANTRTFPTFNQKTSNGSHINNNNQSLDTHTVTSSGTSSIPVFLSQQQKATPSCSPKSNSVAPVASQSRISSYSITSLLGHESSSSFAASNNHNKKETNSRVTSYVDTISSPVSPPSADSRYSSSGTPSSSNKKRSPSYGTPSPLNNIANNLHGLEYYSMMRSPDLSPSPEHQVHPSVFPRYRSPSAYGIMHASSSSPQSYSAGLTPIRSSPSPSNSDSYNPKYKSSYLSESPNHHPYASVSPSHRYSPIPGYQSRKSPHLINKSAAMHSPTRGPTNTRQSTTSNTSPSLSPTMEEPSKIKKEVLPSPGVRNLPKKTPALRQQFQQSNAPSPPSSSSNSANIRGQLLQKEHEKEQHEAERRVYSSVLHPGMPGMESLGSLPIHGSHPSSVYPYMFPPGASPHNSYLNSPFSSYYQQVYANVAYRNPLWLHYPTALAGPPPPPHIAEHFGAPHSSSWSISEHSPSRQSVQHDEAGVLVKVEREESNPDVPLNLSKH